MVVRCTGGSVRSARAPIAAGVLCQISLLWCSQLQAQSQTSDWKMFGVIAIDEKAVHLFYDAAGASRNADGNFDVWTKGISNRDIAATTKAIAIDQNAKDRIAKQMGSGYLPPMAIAQGLAGKSANTVIIEEDIANSYPLEPVLSMHWEIDCKEKRERNLESSIYTNGSRRSWHQSSIWIHPAAEHFGGAAMLLPVFCAQQQIAEVKSNTN